MSFQITGAVAEALDKADAAEPARVRKRQRESAARIERMDRRNELRGNRMDEMRRNAAAVSVWLRAFEETQEFGRIWRCVDGRIELYGASFYEREPAPKDDRTVWAVFGVLAGDPDSRGHRSTAFFYEERYKGVKRYERLMAGNQELVDELHPDYLAQLRAHLEGPDAWKYVLRQIERVTGR